MIGIGRYQSLEVVKLVDFGAYLKADDQEILIPTKYLPENTQPGDIIEVFIYKDSEDRLIATTLKPYGELGEFVALTARQVTQFGAFMGWGLEKDLLVPYSEQQTRINEGEKHVVRISLDPRTERLIGITKFHVFLSKDVSDLKINQKVKLLVYEITLIGVLVIIDQKYSGMIYQQDIFEDLERGDERIGYISKIRDDGKIDVKLASFDAIDIYKQKILIELGLNKGFLPFHDNSDAEAIQKNLNMSKKSFKKAIGGLYKEGKIKIGNDGITFVDQTQE